MGAHATKVTNNKYGQKPLDSAKKIYNRRNKKCIKKRNSRNSRSNKWFIANNIADKITSVSTKKAAKSDDANNEIEVGSANLKDVSVASSKDVPKKDT